MMKMPVLSAVIFLVAAATAPAAPSAAPAKAPPATPVKAPAPVPVKVPAKSLAPAPAKAPAPAPAKTPAPVPAAPAPEPAPAPVSAASVFESPTPPAAASPIDRIVFAKLSSLKIQPALCSDAVFVRRVYLDVIGTLPTAQEAGDFIKDPDTQGKRRALIDRLLEREEFADYWAMKWGDVLRIKAEFPVNLWPNAAQAYHRWVRESIAANKPYDKFVREMLTSSGSNFRAPPVNFYRAIQNRTPDGIAAAVALTFMGSRVESWAKDRPQGLAVFFSQIGYKPTREWKEEHVFWDPLHTSPVPSADGAQATPPPPPPAAKAAPLKPAANGAKGAPLATAANAAKAAPLKPAANAAKAAPAADVAQAAPPPPPRVTGPLTAIFPDGKSIQILPDRDPREVFADWLITPKNPWFARAAVNRIWGWLLGRGIVHEPDDIRDNNPPSNPELLAYLEKEFVKGGYDLKQLYRLILNSNTYQLSSMRRFDNPQAEANFAAYPLRRLDAEVLIDAINKITGTSDLYTSPIPEPFTYIPRGFPAIAIADGSITSPFLALFGRSARATGLENERENKPVPAQWLFMLNSTNIQAKLEQSPRLKPIFEARRKPSETVEELYLTVLSRFPTPQEVKNAEDYPVPVVVAPSSPGKPPRPPAPKKRDDWIDITWSLINSIEFLYRH